MTVLDKPFQIEIFKLGQVVHRLDLEIKGLGFRQSTLAPAKRYYNLKGVGKKAKALEVLRPAYEKALRNPTQIWRILAEVRGSRFFFHCDVCTWEGDETTVGRGRIANDEGWYCPDCKHDESGLKIEEWKENAWRTR